MGRNTLEMDVQYVKGAGPARKRLLEKLGIRCVEDLLLHRPRAYLDRTRIRPLAEVTAGGTATVEGVVMDVAMRRNRRGWVQVEVLLKDESGALRIVWFHQPYLRQVLRPGVRILATGPVRYWRGTQMVNPEFEVLREAGGEHLTGGRIVPVYPSTAGLSQKSLRRLVRAALDRVVPELQDPLPQAIRRRLGLVPLPEALEQLHFPETMQRAEAARRRLAFDELFFLQLLLLRAKEHLKRPRTARPLVPSGALLAKAREMLPFRLTGAQERVLGQILEDLAQDRPMNRLLEGDVGAGKTVVAFLAAIAAIEAGAQVALMAPTEILAQQHARTAARMLDPLGIPWVLLLGRMPPGAKKEAREGLQSGRLKMAIGTHTLIQEGIAFASLDFVIVDEQQRFGVLQRARLLAKGRSPHGLVMTATPIPRTLALTLYGDLDLSILDEKPPGRLPPKTHRVPERRRADLLEFLARSIREGSQAYVVCPLIEESEAMDLKAATEIHRRLSEHPGLGPLGVGLLHGRMTGEEKERVMEAFREGKLGVLVTTTVVEVGVDVPNADLMVIEHPERYGLSQLHQLRGRVGRGGRQAHVFLMMSPDLTPEARRRLEILTRESDGFRIAEEDLRLRGPGDFFGVAQSGLPPLKMADLSGDADLVVAARREAQRWMESEGQAEPAEREAVRRELERRFRDKAPLYRVG
jgi:ATP-dependent DNA helicase RecG